MAKSYTQTLLTSPAAVARINAAAFRVSHVINQPLFGSHQGSSHRNSADSVNISPAAAAMVSGRGDVRPVVTLRQPAEAKRGIILSIRV